MNIVSFDYGNHEVRTITDENGSPWWVAKDVCEVLGLINPREAVRGLDDDERSTVRISDGTSPYGGNPNVNIINEPGLYTLIIRSNKPEAKKFKRWITHEVLPSIRKTGRYAIGDGKSDQYCFPNLMSAFLYMQSRGLKIKKSKVYLDREKGEIKVQPDGSVLKSDVEAYCARIARAQDEPGIRQAHGLLAGENGKILAQKAKDARALTSLFKVKLGLAKALGFRGNQAVLKANELVREETGIDCAEQCNATHLKDDGRPHPPTASAPALTNDLFKDFVDDECIEDVAGRVGATVLYERFVKWFKHLGGADKIPSQQQFGMLAGKKFTREKVGGIRVYYGLKLVADPEKTT